MMNLTAGIVLSAALLQAVPAQEPGEPYAWDCPGSGYLPFRGELLVSTEALAQLIESSAVTVIHVEADPAAPGSVRRATYAQGHLPGALRLKWSDLAGTLGTLRPAERRWPALGILPGRRVVLYDTGAGLEAAAAFVALEFVGWGGHAALLDGQWAQWVSEGRPLCRWGEEVEPGDLDPRPSGIALSNAEMETLIQEAGRPRSTVTLIDARRTVAGAAPDPFQRRSWNDHLTSPSLPVLKNEEQLRRLWSSVPSGPDRRVVVAAGNWREAAPVYFVARLLGYSVQLLDGSIDDLESALERGS